MRQLYVPAVAILAFSYPFTTVIALQFDLPIDIVNFTIKALVAAIFAVSALGSFIENRHLSGHLWPLYIFFTLYSLRLIYDVVGLGIVPPLAKASYILLYFFGLTMLPALATIVAFDRRDLDKIHRWMLWTLILTNLALAYHAIFVGNFSAVSVASERFEVKGLDEGAAILNPIVISLMGGVLALFLLGRLAVKPRMSIAEQLGTIALLVVSIGILLIGDSRGPVLGFAIGLGVLAFAWIRGQSSSELRLQPRILIYFTLFAVAAVITLSAHKDLIAVFDRFSSMFDGRGRVVEERDYIYAAAWQDFAGSPFIGESYLTMNGTALPHNVLLEAMSSMGLIGATTYIFCIWKILRGLWRGISMQVGISGFPIALAAAAMIAISMTSGTIGQAPEIWVISALVMCMGLTTGHARKREYDDRTTQPLEPPPAQDRTRVSGI